MGLRGDWERRSGKGKSSVLKGNGHDTHSPRIIVEPFRHRQKALQGMEVDRDIYFY